MKKIISAPVFCALCLGVFLSACDKKEDAPAKASTPQSVPAAISPQSPAAGSANASALTTSADGQRYVNERFGLSIEKPEGWFAADIEEMLMMQAEGMEIVTGDDRNMRAILDASLKRTLLLFVFSDAPLGTPGKKIISLQGAAENIGAFPGIKTGCDYLGNVRTILEQSQLDYQVSDDCNQATLGRSGSSFGFIDARLEVSGEVVRQRYFACRQGQYILGIIGTFHDDDGKEKLNQVLSTLSVQCDG